MSQIPNDSSVHSQARDWLVLLTSGRATAADAQALRQWCARSPAHAQAFEQARELWQLLEPAARQAQRVAPLRQFGRRAFLGGAIAASAALVMVGSDLGRPAADFQTSVGEQRRVQLDDGVALELNTQTRISREHSGAGTRFDLLEGEVEVHAPVALQVRAGGGELLAQGARFNVRMQGQNVCVTCLEGQVQVQVGEQRVTVPDGRQFDYSATRLGSIRPFDATQVMAWREQLLVFHDAPLAEVIDEINRYRPGMLVLLNPQLGRRKVQARFSLQQLGGVAQLIRDAYGARCTELPGGVVLVS